MLIQEEMSLQEKLGILADAAKYDVSCSSSGSQRRGKAGMLGNTVSPGICHSFAADGSASMTAVIALIVGRMMWCGLLLLQMKYVI